MTLRKDKETQVAKNTLFLYMRMLFVLFIGLYTSRAILEALGVEDYGINNVVAGVVTMFSVVTGSLSSAISRFITYELGKDDFENLKKVFSTSVTVQFLMSILSIILLESIGLWFVNNKMDIPVERVEAANWVYQSAIFSFVLNLLSVPFTASIIAHEKMNAFAFIGILESILKLGIVWVLFSCSEDRLKVYAILLAVVSLVIRLLYGQYCKFTFKECRYDLEFSIPLIRKMGAFAGWTFFSSFGYILCTQGINILLNIYFGVMVNAARGLATQLDGVVKTFINNITTAISPQITKSYAVGEFDYMMKLSYSGSKITSYLLIFIAVPLLIETQLVLKIWLGTVPDNTVMFLKWTILTAFFDTALVTSFRDCINATGKIKFYQLITTLSLWMVFPLTWFAYHIGASPVWGYVVNFVVVFVLLFLRLRIVTRTLHFSFVLYIKSVFVKVLFVFLFCYTLSTLITKVMDEGYLRLLIIIIVNLLSGITIIYLWGLTPLEKKYVKEKIFNVR